MGFIPVHPLEGAVGLRSDLGARLSFTVLWMFCVTQYHHDLVFAVKVESFKFKEDQKRSMLSRLLQRQCIHTALGLPWKQVKVKRTRGRKPFAVIGQSVDKTHAPNFNFNVSHEVTFLSMSHAR